MDMDKIDLEKFKELYNKFIKDCNRVVDILSNSKERTVHESSNIEYADTFRLVDNSVYWEGEETWSYGGNETHWGYFDADYLTMTDDELMKIVDKENKEYDKKQKAKQKEKEEYEKAKRLAEYEKLKKEFGK